MKIKTYREMSRLETFEERYKYLKLTGAVGESTFGMDRYLNQMLYRSKRWKSVRDKVIIRDGGCDLGIQGREIFDKIIIHHMNPLTVQDIEDESDRVFNLNFLVCTTLSTHNAIHFGDDSFLSKLPRERFPGDTLLWPKFSRRE